jgi:hypothetical protein
MSHLVPLSPSCWQSTIWSSTGWPRLRRSGHGSLQNRFSKVWMNIWFFKKLTLIIVEKGFWPVFMIYCLVFDTVSKTTVVVLWSCFRVEFLCCSTCIRIFEHGFNKSLGRYTKTLEKKVNNSDRSQMEKVSTLNVSWTVHCRSVEYFQTAVFSESEVYVPKQSPSNHAVLFPRN